MYAISSVRSGYRAQVCVPNFQKSFRISCSSDITRFRFIYIYGVILIKRAHRPYWNLKKKTSNKITTCAPFLFLFRIKVINHTQDAHMWVCASGVCAWLNKDDLFTFHTHTDIRSILYYIENWNLFVRSFNYIYYKEQ